MNALDCPCECHGRSRWHPCSIEGGCGHLHPAGQPTTGGLCAAPQCDRPAHGGFLCPPCVSTLRRDLVAVPDLLADLEVTITRQDKISDDSGGRKSDERPLPLRLGPMQARDDLLSTLANWAAQLAGVPVVGASAYLIERLDDIRIATYAGALADEIGYAVIVAQRAVDKPLQLVYVGPCDKCGWDLYAHPRRAVVACRNDECGAEYEIASRREWLLKQAEDQLRTATEISRALPNLLQRPLTAAKIRGWAYTGRLAKHPPLPDRPNEPVYRIGDVIDLCREEAEKESRRRPGVAC